MDVKPSTTADADVRDLAGGALVVFVGKMARLSRGAFLWVITLLCGADVQGLYSLAWGVCSTLNKVARFGLLRSVVYAVTEARSKQDDDRRGESEALAAGILIALCASAAVVAGAYLAAEPLAQFYRKPIADAIRTMSWTAPFIALSWVFTSATRALRIMRYEVYIRSVAGPLMLFAGGAAVGLAGYDLQAIAWVQLVMTAGNLLLSVHYFRRHFSLRATLKALRGRTPWWRMTRFGLPVTLTDLVYALLTQLDVLMLGWYVDAALMGIYVLVRRVASTILKAPQAFDAIFSSIVSDLTVQGRHAELGDRFVTVARWILTVNVPIAASLLLIGDPVLQLLGDSQLQAAGQLQTALHVLFILCGGMMVQSVFAVAEPLLAMSGRPSLNLFNNTIWLGINFGLNLWLIDAYGIVGAAVGATTAMLLVSLLRLFEVYHFRSIVPLHRSQLKPMAAGILAAVPTWFCLQAVSGALASAVLPCVLFLGVYGLVLARLKLETEDRMLLGRAWKGLRRRLP